MLRRFKPPWTAERIPGGYVVKDIRPSSRLCLARETEADAAIANGADDEARRSVLWLADLDVHAFLGDLSGDTWDVDLSDRPCPLVVKISEHAEGHEHSRQKYTEQSIIGPGTQWSAIPDSGSQPTA